MGVHITREESELQDIAHELIAVCPKHDHATVIALEGELGAGKTALTKAIARVLGIKETVTSPTFVIMKVYPVATHDHFQKLIHIDAYRIEHDDEMRVLGFSELLKDPTALIVIEWPLRIANLIPRDAYTVSITINDGTRTFIYGD